MRTRDKSRQLGELVALSEASAQGAQDAMRRAANEHDKALSARDESIEGRDVAQTFWGELVTARPSQPELVRLGANWLLLQERKLAESNLAVAIAGNQLARAQSDYSLALARNSATRQVRSEFARAVENRATQRQADLLTDELLWRRLR